VGTLLDRKFFESTRGRIVTLLRRFGFTVEELAQELLLTNNGVRAHLATFVRDGIVGQRGVVRHESGGGKPAYVYELTPEAGRRQRTSSRRPMSRCLAICWMFSQRGWDPGSRRRC
jgi:predicted ArsR family transcriptional regulator